MTMNELELCFGLWSDMRFQFGDIVKYSSISTNTGLAPVWEIVSELEIQLCSRNHLVAYAYAQHFHYNI
jgi:hypothetical protein